MENMCKNYVIAIDGEAGTGKSTLAKNIAKKYKIVYMDTGAMYRCVTLNMIWDNVSLDEIDKINNILDNIKIDMENIDGEDKFYLNGVDVTKQIREKQVNDLVSQVSHIPVVREKMVNLQRKLARGKNIVMEGRDIGTNVFPGAQVKIYLTASAEERAKRRYEQNKEKGIDISYEEIVAAYNQATIITFPTFYEGFGLPVIEANVMGKPIISSDIPIIHEVGGEAVYYIDPNNISDIRNAIEQLLNNDGLYQKYVLLGEERAIVTEIEGTTRDVLEEQLQLGDLSLLLLDTAGIRSTEDIVEQIGVDRARKQAEDADLILYVADSSRPLNESDEEILSLLEGKKALVLLNKSDLEPVVTPEIMRERTKHKVLLISAKEEQGIRELEEEIRSLFFQGEVDFNDEILITNARHKAALQDARASLSMVKESIQNGMPEDFYTIDLTDAYQALGRILGEEMGEDLINEIFGKFCMGK